MSKIVGYTRVSSKFQLDNNLMQQQEILDRYSEAIIYSEQFTETTTKRPIFKEVEKNLDKGDMLVICKLDRLARSTAEGIELVQGLFNKGVTIHMLNIGILKDNIMGKFFLTTLFAVTEMERNAILERNQYDKSRQGLRKGRPKIYKQKQLDSAIEMLNNKSYKEVSQITGMSMSTLFREVKKRNNRA